MAMKYLNLSVTTKKTGPDGAITVVKVPRLGECRLDKVPLEDLKAIIGEGVR